MLIHFYEVLNVSAGCPYENKDEKHYLKNLLYIQPGPEKATNSTDFLYSILQSH